MKMINCKNGLYALSVLMVLLIQPTIAQQRPSIQQLPPVAISHYDQKIEDLEYQLRQVTGQLEVMTHRLKQMQEKMELMTRDYAERLQNLEGRRMSSNQVAPSQQTQNVAQKENKAPNFQVQQVSRNDVKLPDGMSKEQYNYARSFLLSSDYDKAEVAFKQFIEKNTNSPLISNAYYWLGETYYVRNKYKDAISTFAEGYKKFPRSNKAPGSLLKLGMSLKAINRPNDACKAFKQIQKHSSKASKNILKMAKKQQIASGCQ